MTSTTAAVSTPRPARRAARVLGGSLRALWVLVRVAVVVGAVAVAVAWRVYGYVPVAVQTGSMTPTYPVHTLLFVHDVPDSQVKVGDVITFDPPGRVPRTTHRVVKRELHGDRIYFHTKGDANPSNDDWREPGSAEAKSGASYLRGVSYSNKTAVRTEFSVPYAGWLTQLDTIPHLRMILLLLPFLVVALQLLRWIWRSEPTDDGGGEGRTEAKDEEAAPDARPVVGAEAA